MITSRRSSHRSRPRRSTSPLAAITWSRVDWVTVGLILGLAVFGVLMIFDASNVDAYFQFGNKWHFTALQLSWLAIGCVGLVLTLLFPLKWLHKLSPYIFLVALILLIAVAIPGIGTRVQGARRWLFIGPFSLQPSELVKLAVAVYLPAFLTKHIKLGLYLAMILLLLILLIMEPDMGTAIIVLGMACLIYFLAGAPFKHLLLVGGALVLAGLLVVGTAGYRMARVKTFFNPAHDPLGSSYHVRQIILSLGSGGLTGSGIGRSRQKYQYLPESSTDSIFAVIAEETGFLGAGTIVGLYGLIYLRGFRLSRRISEPYPRLVAAAVMSWLGMQTLLNLAAMVILIPLTGVPLPFISYGGSALMNALMGLGLYANASRYRENTV